LPEINLGDVDTGLTFLGKHLRLPRLISSMNGGVARGGEINRRLAQAAQDQGCAMGVGSQRAAIENPALAGTFRVRDVAPDILLFANLGAVQLNYGYGVEECRRAVDMIGADALILHLNPVQEALQPDGNHDFSGLLNRIARVCDLLEIPVIVKEIGFGISAPDVRRLVEAGVAAVDIAGTGGTSWSAVESYRATDDSARRIGETFSDWGLPTAWALQMARAQVPHARLIASGGLRTGLDAAKAIALGADLAGFAGPLLRAADAGENRANTLLETIARELRLAMFGCGTVSLSGLRAAHLIADEGGGRFSHFVRTIGSDQPGKRPSSLVRVHGNVEPSTSIKEYQRNAL
jgi:isopentenyl-diphosphate delta-isomerase